ncbi:MAG: hypothetical protein AMS17_20540 [Spirochaetes bacterium DG_61]|jgi:hypothetical protein|nr:MAG: hypothetical protein AMS17_20540 [Spirochaetes bacterium DG_61]
MGITDSFSWQVISSVVAFVFGALFHFIFEMSGGWKPVAVIGAVNESTWEHLKIAFWPMFFLFLFELATKGKKPETFLLAKAAGLYFTPALIVILFYSYKMLFHTHSLAYDITIFFCAILAGNILSWKLLSVLPSNTSKGTSAVAVIFLSVIALSFSFLTYFPPRVFLFRDPRTGGFGIIRGGR